MLDVGEHLDILRFARRRLGGLVDLGDQSMTDGYQVQLLIVTDTPLSPTQWSEARAIFAQVRQRGETSSGLENRTRRKRRELMINDEPDDARRIAFHIPGSGWSANCGVCLSAIAGYS